MPVRSRHTTIARVTVGYLLTWVAGLAMWFVAIAVSQLSSTSEGPEFDWGTFAMIALASLLCLIAAHAAWMVVAARMLAPYGHPWRTRVTVIAPPVSLVLVVIARNESLVPWQLWPVALVAVPAVGATWATARR
jgi:drug/metabolite transporter (DMT)-like permease